MGGASICPRTQGGSVVEPVEGVPADTPDPWNPLARAQEPTGPPRGHPRSQDNPEVPRGFGAPRSSRRHLPETADPGVALKHPAIRGFPELTGTSAGGGGSPNNSQVARGSGAQLSSPGHPPDALDPSQKNPRVACAPAAPRGSQGEPPDGSGAHRDTRRAPQIER